MLRSYFKGLYQRTMSEAYGLAQQEIVKSLQLGGMCLDCGAHSGGMYDRINSEVDLGKDRYFGIEWYQEAVVQGRSTGLDIVQGDLNKGIPHESNKFACVFGLSLLEHLLNPCGYLKECQRVLQPGGVLIILTPNISTYFTALLILMGRMPSSGPHPDSDKLIKSEEIFKVSDDAIQPDTKTDTPVHRHLVVFSYRVLRGYLMQLGFSEVKGCGFGLYPFPNFMQPVLEKVDPYHCHQMVFVAKKQYV